MLHSNKLARSCLQGCVVGDKSNIKRCVLGRSCKVGNSVKIINSVLMENVVIEANCQIQNSVICSGVRLQVMFAFPHVWIV
jgi:translation initiation factor eIF-2B subunit gamma